MAEDDNHYSEEDHEKISEFCEAFGKTIMRAAKYMVESKKVAPREETLLKLRNDYDMLKHMAEYYYTDCASRKRRRLD